MMLREGFPDAAPGIGRGVSATAALIALAFCPECLMYLVSVINGGALVSTGTWKPGLQVEAPLAS